MTEPYDFATAIRVARAASDSQRAAEEAFTAANNRAAEAELAYRKALATRILKLKVEKVAITAAKDIATGQEPVSRLRYERDIAKGVQEVCKQAIYRASADRKIAEEFIDWSKRRDIAEGYGQTREPAPMSVIGGRRA